ncbi:RNA 2',3'-cyclic phosphodiesterase [Celerinatantimonas sp. MCCC 1A17872]|uniref:RNA 2',3'-cyclic phosphodiesterase n=1 Tax=Celerinatantimonas sp. MCCC 1A17872 TaxID=3177514 RepID=UPI0038C0D821
MSLPRYFFAIPIHQESLQLQMLQQKWLEHLTRLNRSQPQIRLIAPENFHLTLHFLGPQTSDELQKAKERANNISANSFKIQSNGLGYFAKAKTGYLSIQNTKTLCSLAYQLGNSQPYQPHVSLMRKLTDATLPKITETNLNLQVKGFDLYRSNGNGALYQHLEHFALRD